MSTQSSTDGSERGTSFCQLNHWSLSGDSGIYPASRSKSRRSAPELLQGVTVGPGHESKEVQYDFSPSMLPFHNRLFPTNLKAHFQQCVSQTQDPMNPNLRRPLPRLCSVDMPSRKPSISQKRQRSLHYPTDESETDNDFGDDPRDMIGIPIGDEDRVIAYYAEAFKAFQQLNCRQIAKAYIKAIEPRKQARHPYNGGKVAPGEERDPEKTKPSWWPAGVIHKEPDHLKKIDRIKLLIHILRNLRQARGMTVRKLREAGEDVQQRRLKPREKSAVLEEIYRVREMEEHYEDEQIDASTLVYVTVRKGAKRNSDRDSKSPSELGNPIHSKNRRLTSSPEIEESVSPMERKDAMAMTNPFELRPAFVPITGIKPEHEQFTHHFNNQPGTPSCNAPYQTATNLHGLPSPAKDQHLDPPAGKATGPYLTSSSIFYPFRYSGDPTVYHGIAMQTSQSQRSFPLADVHGTRDTHTPSSDWFIRLPVVDDDYSAAPWG
ncbi:hypothetical protein I7I51_00992 [Histoplasma capsulatum]|uniref:Subtelomeric hrmA-associated cluster protein AFUB-079030/YDR124W-like helical bundle domain-containing protein n=1 Tax=Ajellomyces capsulatus TaxID=5037 RepID=A0A8A1MDD3_AJECA|nr:hypothetical protein I7I51_00992 [Histoplasma capsulatum]